MSDPVTIATIDDARALERRVRASASRACATLSALLSSEPPLEVFRAMKFRRVGFVPTDAERPANLMQQVHQTFAFVAAIRGVEQLLRWHPDHAPYRVDVSAGAEPNIVSVDGQVVAETLAIISPVNNNKLKSDVDRMRASSARHRYVFYYAEQGGDVVEADVRVVAVGDGEVRDQPKPQPDRS